MRSRFAVTLVGLVATVAVLTACAPNHSPDDAPDIVPVPTETLTAGDAQGGPPPFLIRYDETELQLAPARWEWGDESHTGAEPSPPSIGSPDEVFVFIQPAGWHVWSATQFTGEQDACDSLVLSPLIEDVGGGWMRITSAGPPGEYTLELEAGSGMSFAPGVPDGSMVGHVAWATTRGPDLPPPSGTVSLLADDVEGGLQASDLSLDLLNLETMPETATATVTVTASNGESLTFHPAAFDLCNRGMLILNTPHTSTQEVVALGDPPFTFDVEVVLDGTTYSAQATYTTGSGPLELEFEPALP